MNKADLLYIKQIKHHLRCFSRKTRSEIIAGMQDEASERNCCLCELGEPCDVAEEFLAMADYSPKQFMTPRKKMFITIATTISVILLVGSIWAFWNEYIIKQYMDGGYIVETTGGGVPPQIPDNENPLPQKRFNMNNGGPQ